MTNSLHQKFLAIEKRVDPHSHEAIIPSNDEVKSLLQKKVSLEEKIKETEHKEQTLILATQQIKILRNEIKQLEKIKSQQKFAGFLFNDSLHKRITQREDLLIKKKNLEEEINSYAAEYDKSHDYKIEAQNLENEIKQLLKRRKFLRKQADEKAAALIDAQTRLAKYKSLKTRISREVTELTKSNDNLINEIQKNQSQLNHVIKKDEIKLPALPSNKITKTHNLRSLYYQSRFLYNFVNKAKDDFEKIINAYEFENQSNFIINYHEKKQTLTFSVESISLEKEIAEEFFQRKSQLLQRNNIGNSISFEYTPNKLIKSLNWSINVNDLINRKSVNSSIGHSL